MAFKIKLILFLGIFATVSAVAQNNSSQQLTTAIKSFENHKDYDHDQFPLGLFTEDHYAREASFGTHLLQNLQSIEAEKLNQSEKISLELLKFELQEKVDFYQFEAYLNPLLSDAGMHVSLPYIVTDINSYDDAVDYLEKLNAIPDYIDQHLLLIRKGLSKGISQPKIIFAGYESTYNQQIVENPESSFFYQPFRSLPSNTSEFKKDSLRNAAKVAISKNVIPQFKRIKKFFEKEYIPQARKTIGVSEIPNGAAFYQNRLDYYTTTHLTAEEIHEIGLEEVQRINKEMKKVLRKLDFDGDKSEFIDSLRTDPQFYANTPEELLKEARNIAKTIDAKLPAYFLKLPRKPYGVAPVPAAIAPKYTTGRYIGASNDREPGYFWVNTYDLKSRPLYVLPSLAAHESVPGHHLQISLNSELGDSIPRFRRGMYLSVYGEGWGLYSEFLADEMGLYKTPYELYGKLTYEQWRACRLVVDTGIHAKGWTRKQAVDFLKENTALSLHEINTEVDRYISWPGQAVSYKIGEMKIRELRSKAEKALKEDFDIREFHNVILSSGTVTLKIMEDLVNDYIAQKSK